MVDVLMNPIFARLFSAQVIALLGTGLLTVALALAAYDVAGAQASVVLGIALTIKMIAYVGLSPIASALVSQYNRKAVLIVADLVRAAAAIVLPFVDAAWQIYLVVLVLQAASATFTPAFQATIPDVLPREEDYTKALSLSRLAYDLENIISPLVAAMLLTVISFHWLFAGTMVSFLISAVLVLVTAVPNVEAVRDRSFNDRLTLGSRIFGATPRLRGLFFLNFTAAAIGAVVIVNTVVIVRYLYEGSQSSVAVFLAAFGCGSMISALALPRLLDRISDRTVMISGAFLGVATYMAVGAYVSLDQLVPLTALLMVWFVCGLAYSAILTPSGRLLRRSARREDRPALFAAQFALSHACWLITYPMSGILFDAIGMGQTLVVLGGLAGIATLASIVLWPVGEAEIIEHSHEDLPVDHPHLREAGVRTGAHRHRHYFVIDDEHRAWPTQG
ncbi:MAG: MFS transporter [Pseudomonadota bacterium]